jgi:hypothetical protein
MDRPTATHADNFAIAQHHTNKAEQPQQRTRNQDHRFEPRCELAQPPLDRLAQTRVGAAENRAGRKDSVKSSKGLTAAAAAQHTNYNNAPFPRSSLQWAKSNADLHFDRVEFGILFALAALAATRVLARPKQQQRNALQQNIVH